MNERQLDMVLGYLNEGTEIDEFEFMIESINEIINQFEFVNEEVEILNEGKIIDKIKELFLKFVNFVKKVVDKIVFVVKSKFDKAKITISKAKKAIEKYKNKISTESYVTEATDKQYVCIYDEISIFDGKFKLQEKFILSQFNYQKTVFNYYYKLREKLLSTNFQNDFKNIDSEFKNFVNKNLSDFSNDHDSIKIEEKLTHTDDAVYCQQHNCEYISNLTTLMSIYSKEMVKFKKETNDVLTDASTINQNSNHDGEDEIAQRSIDLLAFSKKVVSESNKIFSFLTNGFSVLNTELSKAIKITDENTKLMLS